MTDNLARPVAARVAIALWLVFAAVVWQMRFDWQTRMAAFRFADAQMQARARGQRVVTIADGFRPEVSAAAREALFWAVGIAVAGGAAVGWAARPGRRAMRAGSPAAE